MEGALRQLIPTQLITAAAATYYVSPYPVPGNGQTKMYSFIFANTDTVPRSITGYNVPFGGTAAAGNTIFPATAIPANTTWIGQYQDGFLVIPAGGFLQFLGSIANKITITMNGVEIL